MTLRRVVRLFSTVPLVWAVAACSDGGVQEIKEWMEATERQTKLVSPKIPEPKKFTPFQYDAKNLADPYSPTKLAVAFAKSQGTNNGLFKPDLDRRREALEVFPLDAIKMVGTLNKLGANYALLQTDKTVFQVKVGNYIGQNFGKITRITDTEIEVKEIVQDAAGDWVERNAKLELQEATK